MTVLLAFLSTAIGRAAASALILAIAFGGWLAMHDKKVAKKAVEQVVIASQDKGKKANATNDAVRRDAGKPGAFERLRKDPLTCRDC